MLCRLALDLTSSIQLACLGLLSVMLLRYLRSQKPLLTSLPKVGTIVKDGPTQELLQKVDFDVIIVGGGKLQYIHYLFLGLTCLGKVLQVVY